MRLTPEHSRIFDDSATAYHTQLAALKALDSVGPKAEWKSIRGQDYLYERRAGGWGQSLGARSVETEAVKETRDSERARLEATIASTSERLRMLGAQYRALRLPRIHPILGAILREADRRGLLGKALVVVGTNSMPAYEIEAQELFLRDLSSTNDCDFAWCANVQLTIGGSLAEPRWPVYAVLKSVDNTFTPNYERPFQARNKDGYEVELLSGPTALATLPKSEQLRPMGLIEQDWLTFGTQMEHVVFDMNGLPARLCVPDPRWMALHKLWLSNKPERNPNKVLKDREQGARLARAVVLHMPRFPIDADFVAQVPGELQPYLNRFPSVVNVGGLDSAQYGQPVVERRS